MKALAALASLLALIGVGGSDSGPSGEITFTAATSYPKVFTLYGVRSDGTGLRIILRNVSIPKWSPNGARFVYYGTRGFYVAGANGHHVRLVLSARCSDGSDDAWSADGSLLALACTTTGADLGFRSRIVVVRADGTRAHRVHSAGGAGNPQLGGLAWSPNGALAFYETRLSKARRLDGSLFTVSADGTHVRRLAAVHGFVSLDERPSWRRDGRMLAFRQDAQHFALLDLRTHRIRRVVRGTAPVFSPDGTRLALSRDGLYVARNDASRPVRVAGGVLPAWSPDSRELAYMLVGPRVGIVQADGRNRRTLTRSYVDMLDLEWRR